jgi:hypothetical protein
MRQKLYQPELRHLSTDSIKSVDLRKKKFFFEKKIDSLKEWSINFANRHVFRGLPQHYSFR